MRSLTVTNKCPASEIAEKQLEKLLKLQRKVAVAIREAQELYLSTLNLPIKGNKVRIMEIERWGVSKGVKTEHVGIVRNIRIDGINPSASFSKVKKDGTESQHQLYIWGEFEIIEIIKE